MLIAQITDTHIGFDPDDPEEYNMHRLQTVLARLADMPDPPDLLLLTGDLTEFGDLESYHRLAREIAGCPFPVHPIVGNHDMRQPFLEVFAGTPSRDGFIQYAVDLSDLRLLLLDTLEPGRHGGAFCETRAAWLTRELADHPDTPTLIVMHHPPFESGLSWLDANGDDLWIARFRDAIAGHGQIRAILCGHLHRTIHTVWNGVALTVCASTAPLVGLDLRPIDPQVPDGRAMITDEPPVFALHRWDGTRLVSHFEGVADHQIFARYDETVKDVVQLIDEERRQRY